MAVRNIALAILFALDLSGRLRNLALHGPVSVGLAAFDIVRSSLCLFSPGTAPSILWRDLTRSSSREVSVRQPLMRGLMTGWAWSAAGCQRPGAAVPRSEGM